MMPVPWMERQRMLIIGFVFAAVTALLHAYFFALESLLWRRLSTRKIFGIRSEEEARVTERLAFNQGFYNLFLALMILIGVSAFFLNDPTIGLTLVFAGCAFAVAAGLVLLVSSPRKYQAALVQGVPPVLAMVLITLG